VEKREEGRRFKGLRIAGRRPFMPRPLASQGELASCAAHAYRMACESSHAPTRAEQFTAAISDHGAGGRLRLLIRRGAEFVATCQSARAVEHAQSVARHEWLHQWSAGRRHAPVRFSSAPAFAAGLIKGCRTVTDRPAMGDLSGRFPPSNSPQWRRLYCAGSASRFGPVAMSDLTPLERAVFAAIAAPNDEAGDRSLALLLASARGADRERSGHGFFTTFKVDRALPPLAVRDTVIPGPDMFVTDGRHLLQMGFVLWVDDEGYPECLEGFQYAATSKRPLYLDEAELAGLKPAPAPV
jgi:hypothetical protein